MKNQLSYRQPYQQGQSLVEFSILLVIVLILLMGIFDLARIYFVNIALEDGAGEAALYLSVNPACRTATDVPDESNPNLCADPNNAEYRARTSGGGYFDWSKASITVERPVIYGAGDPVAVTIEYPFEFIMPLMPKISGVNPFPLRGYSTQVILTELKEASS